MEYRTLNPTTGLLIETYPPATEAEIERSLGLATEAYRDFRRQPFRRRAAILESAAGLLEARADELARLMALEMGKILPEGRAEIAKSARVCRFYAEKGEEYLAPRPAVSDGSEAWVRHDPLGPILAIMPWNFPFWQAFRFAAPALAVGNVALLKHAPSTPRCALAITELLAEAGAPDGVFQNLFLTNEQAARVIADERVRGVTLTGSTRAGREVAAAAGKALKPMVLELGGADPFLLFADADLEEAVRVGAASRCLNNGQSCIASKRFLVERPVLDRFLDALVGVMKDRVVGDPTVEGVGIGPLARADLRDQLAEQVERARAQGATALCGGEVPESDGYFYPPTVLTGLPAEAPAAREELFGPVAVVFPFDDEQQVLELANGTPYGLGASLWTADRQRADRLIPEIEAGSVFLNGLVKSDMSLPFGGIKDSGFGRELGREGMLEFTNVKTVWIK